MQKLGTWLLKALLRLLGLLPLRIHYALGGFVAWLASDVIRYRRDVVVHNLARSFPEKNFWELKPIRKEFYRHFGELIAETVWFGGCNAKRLRRQRLVEVENPEVGEHLFQSAPSLVLLSSHCGNWELAGGILTYNFTDIPLSFTEQNFCVVYREPSSKVWDAVMRDNRTAPLADSKHFPGYIESRSIIRYAYSHRAEKKVYNLMTDQRPYFASSANMDVEFLGQKAQTMTGGAALACKFGLAVAYVTMRRDRRGHYLLRYTPICENASRMSVEQIMKQYYTLLEKDIREQPANYLWTHKRFENYNTQNT